MALRSATADSRGIKWVVSKKNRVRRRRRLWEVVERSVDRSATPSVSAGLCSPQEVRDIALEVENIAHVDNIARVRGYEDAEGADLDACGDKRLLWAFMKQHNDADNCTPKADRVARFCSGASLELLCHENGEADTEKVALLYETSIVNGELRERPRRGPLSARQLCVALKEPVRISCSPTDLIPQDAIKVLTRLLGIDARKLSICSVLSPAHQLLHLPAAPPRRIRSPATRQSMPSSEECTVPAANSCLLNLPIANLSQIHHGP
jgi:hypothetical protein